MLAKARNVIALHNVNHAVSRVILGFRVDRSVGRTQRIKPIKVTGGDEFKNLLPRRAQGRLRRAERRRGHEEPWIRQIAGAILTVVGPINVEMRVMPDVPVSKPMVPEIEALDTEVDGE